MKTYLPLNFVRRKLATRFFCTVLLTSLPLLSFAQYSTKNTTSSWEDPTSWNPRPIPTDDPDDGILSAHWYQINGTIKRTGNIQQEVTTEINGTLEVSGDYTITGGTLNIIGKLIVHGNFSSNSDIIISGGGQLIVYKDLTMTAGTIDTYGDVVVGGNFATGSPLKIENAGNVAIAGNCTDTNGTISFFGTPSNKESFYTLGTLNTPNWATSVCPTVTPAKICDYGGLTELIANDNPLYLILLNMGKIPCSTITISTQPIAKTVCEGKAASLSVTATGATGYQWRKDGTNLSGETSSSITLTATTLTDAGNYDIVLSDGTCTKTSTTALLTVQAKPAKPTITPSGAVSFCSGSSLILNPSASTGYLWSDGSTNASLTINSAGSFTVQAKDINGCLSDPSDGVVATINPLPIPTISGSSSVCEASLNNVYTTEAGMSNYVWTVSAGGTIKNGGTSIDHTVSVTWNDIGPQTVSVSYTNTNGCTASSAKSIAVTVNKSYTPVVSISSSPISGCQGIPVTFTATPTNGGVTPTYNWFVNSSSIISSTSNTFTYSITAYDAVKCIMTSSLCSFPGTNPTTSNILTKVLKHHEITLAPISPSSFCAGSMFNVNITVPCDFVSPNTFSVLLSDATGSFASPTTIGTLATYLAGSYTIPCTIPVATPTGTNYQIMISSSYANVLDGKSAPSNVLAISSTTGTPISPTIYGTTGWNVFCYSGNSYTMSANTYMGYYTENNLSFDSRSRWASGTSPAIANSTSGLAYQGCTSMPATNIALSFKRTNIPCGYYQINMPYHDDAYELYIDGVKVSSHYGCCDTHTNIWTGWINTSTTVEFRLFQGGGGSGLQVSFVNSNPLIVTPLTTTICSGYSTTLTASGGGAGVTYSWTPTTGLSASTGPSVTASPTTTTNYTVTATDASSHCMASVITTVNVSATINLTVAAAPTTTVCGGVTSTTLTATGANTYTWSPATGLSSTSGSTVVASPTSTVTYTVTGSTGCNTTSKTITIVGMNPGGGTAIDTADFGNGTWNVLGHASTTYTDYYGYYTENNLSFNTATRWAAGSPPSSAVAASGSAYSGCTLPASYSLRFKRTNIPCGYYSLTINHHDDGASFWINGKQVWSNAGYVPTVDPNVWTGFIGPSSKVELRLVNTGGPGRLDVSFAPAVPNSLSTPATICAGTSTTFSTTTMAGAIYSWSAQNAADLPWLSTTLGSSTVATPPLLTPDGIHNFICTTTDATGTGCSVDQTLPLEVRAIANTTVTPTSTTVNCPSANVKLTASGANTYTWTSIPAGFSATGATVTVNPAVTTTYNVSGSNNCNAVIASSTITVNPLPDPTSYPSGKWFAYVYNSTATTNPLNYTGSYNFNDAVVDDYSFNTTTQWNNTAGPSLAAGYTGCAIGGTNYTAVFKRTGFTCGYYQIDIPAHDDGAYLYIDGVLQWSHTGCCDAHTDVWKGYLTSTNKIDVRFTNGGGPGYLAIKFTKVSPIVNISPASPAVCSGTLSGVDITVTANGTGNSYSWSPTTYLSAPTSATTNANPLATTTYTVTVSNCSGTVMGSKSVTVDALSPSVIGTQPAPQNICEGTNAAFSITSSNPFGFVWQLSSDGTNWSDMTNAGVYSGVLTKDLALTNVPFTLNGMKYRCKTTVCSSVFSNDALLTVKKAPTFTPGTYYSACQGASNFTIPYTATGSPLLYSLTGFDAITDATLSTSPLYIPIPVAKAVGIYPSTLKVKDVNGCESVGIPLTLKLFKVTPGAIYNRPNK